MKLGKFIMKSAITMTPDIAGFADCFKDESEKVAATMESFEGDFEKLLKLIGIERIVVFVDDLDRCSSAKVIETFETIKLFLNTPACTFVVGADAEKIQQAVSEVYEVSDLKRQKDFLEKIVQIPFSIPAQDLRDIGCYVGMLIIGRHLNEEGWKSLSAARAAFQQQNGPAVGVFLKWVADHPGMLGGAVRAEVENELNAVIPYVDSLGRGLRGNPRQIKRFLNILSLRQQLVTANQLGDVKPELLVKFAVLEYAWGEHFATLAETVDPASGTSELLDQLGRAAEGKSVESESPTLASFQSEPGLADFILSSPRVDGSTVLTSYLFLAQTSLSRGQPAGLVSADEKTRELARKIQGGDSLLARAAAKRAAAQDAAVASGVVRLLLANLPATRDQNVIVNVITAFGQIGGAHRDLCKLMVKPVAELDGSQHAVALAALTFLEKAKQLGAEVSDAMTVKFSKASPIAAALGKPRTGARRGGGD
jgi:hypothetical protein